VTFSSEQGQLFTGGNLDDLPDSYELGPDNHSQIGTPSPSRIVQSQPAAKAQTIAFAAQDVRRVLQEQRQQQQILTTQLNILFVTNGALLTTLAISKLILQPSVLSFTELGGFLLIFSLLINAILPRQVVVSPNLQDPEFLPKYLALPPEEYQIQMLVNLAETYNANKQRMDDISQSLLYASLLTWGLVAVVLTHIGTALWHRLGGSVF